MLALTVLSLCLVGASLANPLENGKLAGGTLAVAGQFPYMANLIQYSSGAHVCGGAILNSRWVITSATCVSRWGGVVGNVRVHVGSTSVSGGQVYFIEDEIIHPNFDVFSKRYDIAVLRTSQAIQMSSDVRPIIVDDNEAVEDEQVVYSGWGVTGPDLINPSALLRYLNATVISELECVLRYPTHNIHPSQLCTMTPIGTGACYLDEGNPIVRDGVLVGVQSFLYDCGEGIPDVHARLSHPDIFEWLELSINP